MSERAKRAPEHPTLETLIEATRGYVMTDEERDAQIRSWVVGEEQMMEGSSAVERRPVKPLVASSNLAPPAIGAGAAENYPCPSKVPVLPHLRPKPLMRHS
jgi:hypothetical protein